MIELYRYIKYLSAAAVIIFILTGTAYSAPIVIMDNRMENLNGFPSLGRGYSVRSNRLQSMCLKEIKKTKPSFNLEYDIEDVTKEYLKNITVLGDDRLKNSRLNSFIQKYYKDDEKEGTKKYTLKNLIVKVEVNSYYYALDETRSPLSESAKELLRSKNFVTFVNSCGLYYVRSVGTYATYYALLQYRTYGDPVIDEDFKNRLEKGLFNFHGSRDTEKKFKDDARYRGLRVYVQAIGLSKGNMVNLIPVNIAQFRRTVQDAVKLMQDPDSGLITRMEVAPWFENPEIGSVLARGNQEGDQQFLRILKLEANAGVITEINRISELQNEQYYIATMCRNILVKNYVDKSSESLYKSYLGQVKEKSTVLYLTDLIQQKISTYDVDKTLFFNHSSENNESTYISLREFIKYFAKKPPHQLFEVNKRYLYGENGEPGALDCIQKIYKGGLGKVDYRNIPSCVKALKPVRSDVSFLEQYCLPKPVRVVFKSHELKKKKKKKKKKSPEIKDGEPPEKLDDIKSLDDMKPSKKKVRDSKGKRTKVKGKKKSSPEKLEDIVPGPIKKWTPEQKPKKKKKTETKTI